MATRKSHKKVPKVQMEHAAFGPCLVVERRSTATGNDILLAEFPDKRRRSLLADAKFWVTPASQLRAIPATQTAVPVEPDEEIKHDDVEVDIESELAA